MDRRGRQALAPQYTGRDEWLTRRNLAWLTIEPPITVALVWTNPLHGLMRQDVHLDSAGLFPVIGKTFGPWFWFHAAYTYVLLLLTLYPLIEAPRRPSLLCRRQTLVLLIGSLLPLVWNALYNFGLSPIPRHDVSPAVLSLSGAVVAWGLFRCRLFDIVPVAWDTVVEGMDEGVIVLDVQNRIVDLNPAAQMILGGSLSQAIGQPAAEVFGSWPDLLALCRDAGVTRIESSPGVGQAQRHYILRASPLADRHGRPIGELIVLRDITARKQTGAQLLLL